MAFVVSIGDGWSKAPIRCSSFSRKKSREMIQKLFALERSIFYKKTCLKKKTWCSFHFLFSSFNRQLHLFCLFRTFWTGLTGGKEPIAARWETWREKKDEQRKPRLYVLASAHQCQGNPCNEFCVCLDPLAPTGPVLHPVRPEEKNSET